MGAVKLPFINFDQDDPLAKLVADAVAASRETPFNVQVGASNAAGTALQTTFVVYGNTVAFLAVNISRAQVQASLLLAFILADFSVNYFKVAFLIHLETV